MQFDGQWFLCSEFLFRGRKFPNRGAMFGNFRPGTEISKQSVFAVQGTKMTYSPVNSEQHITISWQSLFSLLFGEQNHSLNDNFQNQTIYNKNKKCNLIGITQVVYYYFCSFKILRQIIRRNKSNLMIIHKFRQNRKLSNSATNCSTNIVISCNCHQQSCFPGAAAASKAWPSLLSLKRLLKSKALVRTTFLSTVFFFIIQTQERWQVIIWMNSAWAWLLTSWWDASWMI